MKSRTAHGPGLLATVGGVVALLCLSLGGPVGATSAPLTRHILSVDDRTEHNGSDDGQNDTTSGRSDKSEPTHSGLRSHGLLRPNLAGPGALTNDLKQAALSANRQIIQSDTLPASPGASVDTQVNCPAPFQAFNGGESNDGQMVRLTANYPVLAGNGSAWHVQVHNDGPTLATLRVYADCINSTTTPYLRNYDLNIDIPPGSVGEDLVRCPSNTDPTEWTLGGGYSLALDMSNEVAIDDSTQWGDGWLVHWYNYGTSPARISTYVNCGTGVVVHSQDSEGTEGGAYEKVENSDCDPTQDTLAGGWRAVLPDGNQDQGQQYIIVTDSYPIPGGHVVWAHGHNSPQWETRVMCATIP